MTTRLSHTSISIERWKKKRSLMSADNNLVTTTKCYIEIKSRVWMLENFIQCFNNEKWLKAKINFVNKELRQQNWQTAKVSGQTSSPSIQFQSSSCSFKWTQCNEIVASSTFIEGFLSRWNKKPRQRKDEIQFQLKPFTKNSLIVIKFSFLYFFLYFQVTEMYQTKISIEDFHQNFSRLKEKCSFLLLRKVTLGDGPCKHSHFFFGDLRHFLARDKKRKKNGKIIKQRLVSRLKKKYYKSDSIDKRKSFYIF